MGTINFSKSGALTGKITWSSTQNVSANTSTVTAILYVTRGDDYTTYGTSWSGYVKIGDEQQNINTGGAVVSVGSGWTEMARITVTVAHAADGSGSVYISGSVRGPSGTSQSGSNTTGGQTVDLGTIARASSISSASNVVLGNNCNVKWTPESSSFTYSLNFTSGSVSVTKSNIRPNSTSSYTYDDYTMSVATWAPAMSTSSSTKCTVTLTTYKSTTQSSSTSIGTSSKTFTLNLPSTVMPTISSFTASGINLWNNYYIQGKSKCNLSMNFAPGAGSSIRSYSITGNGISKSGSSSSATSLSGETSVITKSGSLSYIASVTDGRGTTTSEKTIYVYPYSNPTAKLNVVRKTENPTDVNISYTAECSSINNKNSIKTIEIYMREKSSTTWVKKITSTAYADIQSKRSGVVDITGECAQDKEYEFYAKVYDTAYPNESGSSAIAPLSTVSRLLNIRDNKSNLAIGKLASETNYGTGGLFEVGWDACFDNRIILETTSANNGTVLSGHGTIYKEASSAGTDIIYIRSGQNVDNGTVAGLAVSKNGIYVPSASNDGKVSLGQSGRRWSTVYAGTAAINTSDRNQKKDIQQMSDAQEQLFNKLKPVTYKFIDGSSDRTHYGFISQDIEESLNELGMSGKDFAGFCKDIKMSDGDLPIVDKDNNKEYIYSLRYSEFIALNTYMIQNLKKEIAELKQEIKELKEANAAQGE